jgi:ribosomal protein S18 acetylase RimI-like enzyme
MTVMVACNAATGAAAAAPSSTTSVRRHVRLRPFRGNGDDGNGNRGDADAVKELCRDVYGGTDYMPRVIEHLGELAARSSSRSRTREGVVGQEENEEQDEHTIVLVAEEEAEEQDQPPPPPPPQQQQQQPPPAVMVLGVVVAQLRGEGHAFLFGLRVHPRARGRGVGKQLMAGACQAAIEAGVRHLVGATIPSNHASVALFARTGHREVARVDVWPPFPLLSDYERHVGFSPPPGKWPGEEGEGEDRSTTSYAGGAGTKPHVRLLDHLAGGEVRRLLLQEQQELAAANLPPPRRCECVEELTRALAAVRRRQRQQQRRPRKDGALASDASQWVPAMYEAMPARGPWARQRVREGGAWLLFGGGGEGGRDVEAVVVAGPSLEARRFVAGVVAVDGSAAARALLLAEQLTPRGRGHFLAFLDVASGGQREEEDKEDSAPASPPPARCALSRLYRLTQVEETHPEGRGCMLVFHREVDGEGV